MHLIKEWWFLIAYTIGIFGGLWRKQRVWNVVGKVLTAEECKGITGEEYIAAED